MLKKLSSSSLALRWPVVLPPPVTLQFALCSFSLCFSSLSSMSMVWSLCWCLWSYLLLEIDLCFSCSFAQLEHRQDYYP
ncbi:unnamed protein product [Brassica napus]|uniref:(rape) hypothetical protein n=1 Tax=Brassica napus TaxID=3708 RepID=A0A816NWQ3_BRANA|nr:unnamed protein product [Brassica napus]